MFSKIMNFVCFTLKLHDGNIGTEFTVSPLSNMDCKIVAHLYILFIIFFFPRTDVILFSVGYQSMVLSLFYAGGEKKKQKTNKKLFGWLCLCVFTQR